MSSTSAAARQHSASAERRSEAYTRTRNAVSCDKFTVSPRRGAYASPGQGVTVAEAAEGWFKRVGVLGMRGTGPAERSTLRQYRQHIELYIKPRLGNRILAELTAKRIEEFRNDLLAQLSRQHASKVFTSFKSLLKAAGFVHLAADVYVGRDKRQERGLERGRDIPTPEEIERILAAARDIGRRALLLTTLLAGLRASELRGLRWRDVDLLSARKLHVRQRADRFNLLGGPISAASARTLDLPEELVRVLRRWRPACPKGPLALVFPSSTGGVKDHASLIESLSPVMVGAGVVDVDGRPKYGLHAFRHFFADRCIARLAQGGRELPPEAVQALLGHSAIARTMALYGHLFAANQADCS